MYTITVDHDRRIVSANLAGFFNKDEVAAFARDEQSAAASLKCGSGQFGLLLETPGGIAQSQEVVTAFQRLLTDLPLKAGRVAIVCNGAILTFQLRRIMTAERTSVFDQRDDAIAWIRHGLSTSVMTHPNPSLSIESERA